MSFSPLKNPKFNCDAMIEYYPTLPQSYTIIQDIKTVHFTQNLYFTLTVNKKLTVQKNVSVHTDIIHIPYL